MSLLRVHPGTLLAAVALLACGMLAPGARSAPAPAPTPRAAALRPATKPVRATALTSRTPHRPLTLAAQTIEGRSEAPRVLFVHTGPKIALDDAPKHPSYLRDDFTAALSSPVTVRVRMVEPLRASSTPGGSR